MRIVCYRDWFGLLGEFRMGTKIIEVWTTDILMYGSDFFLKPRDEAQINKENEHLKPKGGAFNT